MHNSVIMIKKQIKDTFKNKTIIIQFILFPIMTLVMENAIRLDGMPDLFFTRLFSVMYIGMAPLTAMSAILSEEKEKNTLRVLMMADVKPWEYLLGIGVYVWTICMAGAGVMSVGFSGKNIVTYLCFMGIGFAISIIAGACVGIFAKNQMSATSIAMPVMMVFSFVPMLAMFNTKVSKFAKIFYTQQLKLCLDAMSFEGIAKETYVIIVVNAMILCTIFVIGYKRKGLE